MITLERKTANNINPLIYTYRLINLDTMVISQPVATKRQALDYLVNMQMHEYQDTDNWDIIEHTHMDELIDYAKANKAVITGVCIEA